MVDSAIIRTAIEEEGSKYESGFSPVDVALQKGFEYVESCIVHEPTIQSMLKKFIPWTEWAATFYEGAGKQNKSYIKELCNFFKVDIKGFGGEDESNVYAAILPILNLNNIRPNSSYNVVETLTLSLVLKIRKHFNSPELLVDDDLESLDIGTPPNSVTAMSFMPAPVVGGSNAFGAYGNPR